MIALIILIVMTAYVEAAITVFKAVKTLKGKITVAAIFFLIPFGDVIAGRAYFHYLCATEGGIKVHKVVELGPEYWEPDGRPKFVTTMGGLDKASIGARYKLDSVSQEHYVPIFRIDKNRALLIDRQTEEVIGERVWFLYWGGWLMNSTGLHVTATSCHGRIGDLYQGFLKHLFKPTTSAQ